MVFMLQHNVHLRSLYDHGVRASRESCCARPSGHHPKSLHTLQQTLPLSLMAQLTVTDSRSLPYSTADPYPLASSYILIGQENKLEAPPFVNARAAYSTSSCSSKCPCDLETHKPRVKFRDLLETVVFDDHHLSLHMVQLPS